jgi:hypothetical protein
MRYVLAFGVGVATIWLWDHERDVLLFVVKAIVVGFFVLALIGKRR